jgi:hypothetical protein
MEALHRDQIVAGLELLTDSAKRTANKVSTALAVRMAEQRQEQHAAEWRARVGRGTPGPSAQRHA